MEWRNALALVLLVLPAALAVQAFRTRGRRPALALPTVSAFRVAPRSLRSRLGWLPLALRLAALVAIVLAVARPRMGERFEEVITHGVDMVVALDVSRSMGAEDFRLDAASPQPKLERSPLLTQLPRQREEVVEQGSRNRLDVAKEVVRRFINTRKHDRLALVVFAGKAYTQCPLTLDYRLLKRFIEDVSFDTVEDEGTAIGMALATSLNRLRRSEAESRVIVLVTDGINTRAGFDPVTAAQAAAALGVKVYTVGVGTRGLAPFPAASGFDYLEIPLDEETLREVASVTGGFYFRATDGESFSEALRRIGELERTRVVTREFFTYEEFFGPFLVIAVVLLMLEAGLRTTWLRRLT